MRPRRFLRFVARATVACSLPVSPAQQLKPTQQQMFESLRDTSRVSALESAGANPFRLSATFSTFDYQGKPAGDGTLEETCCAPEWCAGSSTFADYTVSRSSMMRLCARSLTMHLPALSWSGA